MEQETVMSLYQLEKKYNCTVTSYYESYLKAMVFQATINCSPCFNVRLQIPEDVLVAQNLGESIESEICQYFDSEFSKFFNANPTCIKPWLATDADEATKKTYEELQSGSKVISMLNWNRRPRND
jgi:hypothetical protein